MLAAISLPHVSMSVDRVQHNSIVTVQDGVTVRYAVWFIFYFKHCCFIVMYVICVCQCYQNDYNLIYFM